MADTIKVPGIKDPLPKPAVLGGIAVTVVLILIHLRKQKNAGAAAPGGAAAATGLSSGGLLAGAMTGAFQWDGTYGNPSDPYSLDTSTGQTYGNEGYLGGLNGGLLGGGGGGGGGGGQLGGPPFASNAAWSAYVLQQDAGAHPHMASALGRYLDGQVLDASQQDLIYQAQAIAGPVPVPGAGGYPPKLRIAGSRGDGNKGGTRFAANPVKGLHATPVYYGITIAWDRAEHATGYQVSLRNVTGHRTAHAPVTTVHTTYTFRDLTGGDEFEATVLARPAEKGARAATVRARPAALMPQQHLKLPQGR